MKPHKKLDPIPTGGLPAVVAPTLPAAPESIHQILALAIDKGVAADSLSKLLDVQERWEANQARKAYTEAMAAFKAEAPAVLSKDGRVEFTTSKGTTHYTYANLGTICAQITAILSKHGLSASWMTTQAANSVTVECQITHVQGHRETVALTAPHDVTGNKNAIQAIGSTVTYLQRYTLLSALGLATADQDDNGQASSPRPLAAQVQREEEIPLGKIISPAKGEVVNEAKANRAEWIKRIETLAEACKANGWNPDENQAGRLSTLDKLSNPTLTFIEKYLTEEKIKRTGGADEPE